MRTRGDAKGKEKPDSPTEQGGKTNGGKRFHLKFPKFRGHPRTPDAPDLPGAVAVELPKVLLTFEQNLEQRHLCEASRQLIEREERLFGEITGETKPLKCQEGEEEVKRLAKDRRALVCLVEQILRQSFSAGEENLEALTSAVKAVSQEEQQDQQWAQSHQVAPEWRPSHWRELHNSTLRSLVEERMDDAEMPACQGQQSSIQQHICSMGKQLKQDLLSVVRDVKGCYPPEFAICNFYARLYHRAFSARLKKIADFGLEMVDCTTLLCWVNEHYPNILQKEELVNEIDSEALGQLLPKEMLENLEEQYLTSTQEKLQSIINRALKEAEEAWTNGDEPERTDGCFVSPLGIDVVQFINGAVRSVEMVSRDQDKVKKLVCMLEDFLLSFAKFHEDVMKRSTVNSKQFVMANLDCVQQFRDFIVKKKAVFPDDVRERCLTAMTAMKQSAHTYLSSPMHKELKPQYRTLGTNDWLKKPLFGKLLTSIEAQIQDLQGLTESSRQELMDQLQHDVTVEYVRRLLKGQVKLKDKQMQEQAARTVTENGQKLHSLFEKAGSKDDWLKEILPKIAEVLKLQDLPSLQIEIASLGSAYPDLSDKHVSALLKLKTNLSKDDRRRVKAILMDSVSDGCGGEARAFFCKVQLK